MYRVLESKLKKHLKIFSFKDNKVKKASITHTRVPLSAF